MDKLNKNKDLEFEIIPKDTCFLSGVKRAHLNKDADIWLSYYGYKDVTTNNIDRAIEFSEIYGKDCGIAFFRNKEELKLLYIPYVATLLENNQAVLNRGISTLKTLINYVKETKISETNKNIDDMKLALYKVFISGISISNGNLIRNKERLEILENSKKNKIDNPDYLTTKIIKQFIKTFGFDGWIRKSKKSEITIGDEIYLFNRNKLSLVCNDFCNKGTRPIKKYFCESDCKFQNGGSSKKI